jgi:hypothetical protein
VAKEIIGGKFLKIEIRNCTKRTCPVKGCAKKRIKIVDQKYYRDQFGVKNRKIHKNPGRIPDSGEYFAINSEDYLFSSAFPAIYLDRKHLSMAVGGEDKELGDIPCEQSMKDYHIDLIREMVAEYNYKKALEAAWKKK